MKSLVFMHDAFGGFGGIAKFNRDLLAGLCSYPQTETVTALPRLMPLPPEPLPPRLRYCTDGVGGGYTLTACRTILLGSFDLIVCAHINLLPHAWAAGLRNRAPLVLVIHGIDAWSRPSSFLERRLAPRVDFVLSVSDYTRRRFADWAAVPDDRVLLLPNCIDLAAFQPGPRDAALARRYGIEGKRVIMTLGRLVSQERAKGMDEVIECLPELRREIPDLVYLVAGDGPDRPRLAAKAAALGVADHVVFTGRVSEAEKAAHFRLADAYVMPSHGEGFGIVLLEAMACGVPTVGSGRDGGREALRDGRLGIVVDPQDSGQLKDGIRAALGRAKTVPDGLDYFSDTAFERRLHAHLDGIRARTGMSGKTPDGVDVKRSPWETQVP